MKENILVTSQVMMPNQTNPHGNVHGGEIVKMMDSTAAAVARRYAHANTVTARIDEVEFSQPIRIGDLVTCTAEILFVGHSSLEIDVTVDVEDIGRAGSKPERALTAFFTMVALDRNDRPMPLRPIVPETPLEKKKYEIGRRRYEKQKALRLKRRQRAIIHEETAEDKAENA
jgi:acyl-CoA hydrolase